MSDPQSTSHHAPGKESSLPTLILGALGIVYGDIGTSPLYALKESFNESHGVPPTVDNVFGILSLVFWSLTVVITLKYVLYIMRADNHGEGGIMALVALSLRIVGDHPGKRLLVLILGMSGVALFYGDGMITPAISVLSAIEGLEVATPFFKPFVIPLTMIVLFALFVFQRRGTGGVGALFGPIMCVWFVVLATVGISNIIVKPEVLWAVNPLHAVEFFIRHKGYGFLVLGAVVLSVTGAEALYADMGHFGKKPIQYAWLAFVFPALVLNYFGQGAAILQNPAAVKNPFYLSAPSWALYPMVILATAATVIASQAVISGAFSATKQAIQLGYAPRLRVIHTSSKEIGQIYIPAVNWTLMIAIAGLILGFQSSDNLAAAYGIAVTGTMAIDSILAFGVVLRNMWGWGIVRMLPLMGFFLIFDIAYFGANSLKIFEGGWFPLLIGGIVFLFMSTWNKGVLILHKTLVKADIPLEPFLRQFVQQHISRGPGTAVFMSPSVNVVPRAMLQNLKHNWALHKRIIILSVLPQDIPYVAEEDQRMEHKSLGNGFHLITVKYGFMEDPNIPAVLASCQTLEGGIDIEDTSFFLGRATFIARKRKDIALWRLRFFLGMVRNAESATAFFNIPANRVVELGSRIEL